MQRDIVISWYYPHPPQQVWTCLTEPDLLSRWFMKNDFKAEVGHRFNFKDMPMPAVGWDGIVYSEVLEVIPETKLVYNWKAGPKPGIINMETVLTWTLTPHDKGTMLKLEHRGFKGMKNYLSSIMMEKGWEKILSKKFYKVLEDYTNEQK